MEEGILLIIYGFKANYCLIVNYFFAPSRCKYLAYLLSVL